MDAPLLFVNKSQSSGLLTRSKAQEKSKIFSHVQSRRRRAEAGRHTQTWNEVTFQVTPVAEASQNKSEDSAVERGGPLERSVIRTYPAHNAFDPFHCTVVGHDAGTHAMLQYTFSSAAKITFLAEALAPDKVSAKRLSMRHDGVISKRLRQCVENETLMYATLAYGCSCLGWMQGVVNAGQPPEYFLDKAIRSLRKRLSQPDYHTDSWLPVSIYALAITEMWNGIPDMWERCPDRYAMMRHANKPGLAAARVHLKALLYVVDKAGGWDKYDSYVVESAILADKYLSMYETRPPIIPLTWDPGVLPPGTDTRFKIRENTLPKLGRSLLSLISDGELKQVLQDTVQFFRIAHTLWLDSVVRSEQESWLFFRFQAITHRLMSLLFHKDSPSDLQCLDRCIGLTTLVFLCSVTSYDGAQVGAKVLLQHLREALEEANFWEPEFGERLRFWCVCTGAMTTKSSSDRNWFLAMVSRCCCTIPTDLADNVGVGVLETFFFLCIEQKGQLNDMLCNLSESRPGRNH